MRECNNCGVVNCKIIGPNNFPEMRMKHRLSSKVLGGHCEHYIPVTPINQIGAQRRLKGTLGESTE